MEKNIHYRIVAMPSDYWGIPVKGVAVKCTGKPFCDNGEHHIKTPDIRADIRRWTPLVFLSADPVPAPEHWYSWGNEPSGYVSTYAWQDNRMVHTGFWRRDDLPKSVTMNCPYP